MIYRIYNAELGTLTGYDTFETLKAWETYLDEIAEGWKPLSVTNESALYKITFVGRLVVYLIAILEDEESKRQRLF